MLPPFQWHPSHTCAPIQYTLLGRYINESVCKAPALPPGELLKETVRYLLFHSPSVKINSMSHRKKIFQNLLFLFRVSKTMYSRIQAFPDSLPHDFKLISKSTSILGQVKTRLTTSETSFNQKAPFTK